MAERRDELLDSLYTQLRKQADLALQSERSDHTLSATALVHEAYLRMGTSFENRAHFYASAAEAMRRVLVDHARARQAQKRGGKDRPVPLTDQHEPPKPENFTDPAEILALDQALSRLEVQDPDAAKVVKLRYFTGLDIDQTAAALGLSPSTVKREWKYAKAFLFRAMQE